MGTPPTLLISITMFFVICTSVFGLMYCLAIKFCKKKPEYTPKGIRTPLLTHVCDPEDCYYCKVQNTIPDRKDSINFNTRASTAASVDRRSTMLSNTRGLSSAGANSRPRNSINQTPSRGISVYDPQTKTREYSNERSIK